MQASAAVGILCLFCSRSSKVTLQASTCLTACGAHSAAAACPRFNSAVPGGTSALPPACHLGAGCKSSPAVCARKLPTSVSASSILQRSPRKPPNSSILKTAASVQVLDRLARAPHLSEVLCISDEASSSQAGDDPSSEGLVEPLLRMSHVVRKVCPGVPG